MVIASRLVALIAVGADGRLVGRPVGGVVSGIWCVSSFILRFDVHPLSTICTRHNLLCWSCHPFKIVAPSCVTSHPVK